jgi:HD domain
MLYGHALRSYFFAALLAARDGMRYDAELLYVGCVLHDIGLTPRFADPIRPFEHVSADTCAELVERHGWALPRRYRLHRAVVLHMAPTLPPAEEAEVHLLEAGVACDVTGARSQEVTPERSRSCWPAIHGPASSASSPSSWDPRRPASRSATRRCSCKGSRSGSPTRRSPSDVGKKAPQPWSAVAVSCLPKEG